MTVYEWLVDFDPDNQYLSIHECIQNYIKQRDEWKTKCIDWMDMEPERDRAIKEHDQLRKLCDMLAGHILENSECPFIPSECGCEDCKILTTYSNYIKSNSMTPPTPTPETDDNAETNRQRYGLHDVCDGRIARKLERERDESRKEVRRFSEMNIESGKRWANDIAELDQLRKLCDELAMAVSKCLVVAKTNGRILNDSLFADYLRKTLRIVKSKKGTEP